MYNLGISDETGLVFEGASTSRAIAIPPPMLFPIRFSFGDEIVPIATGYSGYPKTIFREDSYDPVTKVRRGRVFELGGMQPARWGVQNSPIINGKLDTEIRLITYERSMLADIVAQPSSRYPGVVLGWDSYVTYWKIISIEGSLSKAPLMTLKAKTSMGELPEVDASKIPPAMRKPLLGALEKVETSINRLAPAEVIDRCRDALAVIFAHLCGDPSKELMAAIKACVPADCREEDIQFNASRILARLHSRTKPAEQAVRQLREPSDQDATLAVQCLWFVLVENEWAL